MITTIPETPNGRIPDGLPQNVERYYRSEVQRRIETIKRDRYKWAEHAMDGTVPANIAREKQDQLARQLAALEQELLPVEAAGIDTDAALNTLLDRLSDPGLLYRDLHDRDRRRYNQA